MASDASLTTAERPVLRRSCGSGCACGCACGCEIDEQATLRRLGVGTAPDVAPPIVHDVLRSAGEPLDPRVRADLEPAFGRDFSQVRVHADSTAAASASAVAARAYTVGSDIAFAAGVYAPHTNSGRQLLAHELAHVTQAGGRPSADLSGLTVGRPSATEESDAARVVGDPQVAAHVGSRSPAAPVLRREEGTAVVVDSGTPTKTGGRQWEGTMTRTQYRTQAEAAAAGKDPTVKPMRRSWVRVGFDGTNCVVNVPVGVQVRAATIEDFSKKMRAKHPRYKPAAEGLVRSVGAAYLAACNVELNGWFAVELRNCPGEPCAGKRMPIRVMVTETSTNPDFVVCVADLAERSSVQQGSPGKVMLFVRDLGGKTLPHEGGHMALGAPDEYHERDEEVRAEDPLGTSEEREHTDDSMMGDFEGGEKWVRFHERHFTFVPAFLQQAMAQDGHPGCQAVLVEVQRPQPFDFNPTLTFGYAQRGATGYGAFSLGLDVGKPLSRDRRWQAFLGVHAHLLAPIPTEARLAFLAGARIGLEYRTQPVTGGLQLKAFGEAGGSTEIGPSGRPLTPYVGAGARLGVNLREPAFDLGVEAAKGIDLDGDHQQWFRLGVYWGGRF